MFEYDNEFTIEKNHPDNAQFFLLSSPFTLNSGKILKNVTVCYETYGTLNENKDNAILIMHALTGDSHVTRHSLEDKQGWWEICVGPGKAVDTDKYFVICSNVLGGCRGTTGPEDIDPDAGTFYGSNFPEIAISDMVKLEKELIDHLGIRKLHALLGGSMGGMQALEWGRNYPEMSDRIIVLASTHRVSSQALAFDIVARNAITHDEHFNDGFYYDQENQPDAGLAIARMIGHITYLSPDSMRSKFEHERDKPRNIDTSFEQQYAVGSYLGYQGDKFVERFDANSYITITNAIDSFDLGASAEEITEKYQDNSSNWLFISFSSDWLFPPHDLATCAIGIRHSKANISFCNVESDKGHDAFLLEDSLDTYGKLIRNFLETKSNNTLSEEKTTTAESLPDLERIDHNHFRDLIEPGASVLDLGCGDGTLLESLRKCGSNRIAGVDIGLDSINSCISKNIPVIRADLNKGLNFFAEKEFDYVTVSLTLQSVMNITELLEEVLRIGKRGIVSFPNFAYYKLVDQFVKTGRAPVTKGGILNYNWYETPNIRFFSIKDFYELCAEMNIRVLKALTIDTESGQEINEHENNFSDLGIFLLEKE